MHLSKSAQIAQLNVDKASIKIFSKYANFADTVKRSSMYNKRH